MHQPEFSLLTLLSSSVVLNQVWHFSSICLLFLYTVRVHVYKHLYVCAHIWDCGL